jgi:hypothetical protein
MVVLTGIGVGGGVGNYSYDFNGDKYSDTFVICSWISVSNTTLIFLY